MFVLLVLLTFVVALTIDYLVQRADARREALAMATSAVPAVATAVRRPTPPPPAPARQAAPSLGELGRVPAGLFLAPGHDWLQLESSGAVRLGTDRLALTLLGGLDRLELLPAGSVVHRGDALATLHFGGRSLVLRSPIDAVIDEVNTLVGADPQRLARDPFEEGWLYRLRARGLAPALRSMKVAEEAAAWMSSELARVRDFAAMAGEPASLTLRPGLAASLPEREWTELTDRIYSAQ